MQSTEEDLIAEGKEFFKINRRFKQDSSPDAGTVAYIISKSWMRAYKKYISYKQIKQNQRPELEQNHIVDAHPGKISNDHLIDDDVNLLTSGDIENNFEDVLIKSSMLERYDYKVLNEEVWNFLVSRYQGTPIKRFYKHNSYGSSECEVKLAKIPVYIATTSSLNSALTKKAPLTIHKKFLSIGRSKNYGDFKKRIAICLSKGGTEINSS